MRYSILAPFALAAISFVRAQVIHNVTVGGLNHDGTPIFTPTRLNVSINDIVLFTFFQKNHTVTQSSLQDPCNSVQGGFDTGFQPVAPGVLDNFPAIQMEITDAEQPIFLYCRQTGHCQAGMRMAINANDEQFAQFMAADTNSSSSSSSSSSSGSGSGSGSGSTPPPPPPPPPTSPTTHTVAVGENGTLAYNPPNIAASVGDIIKFEFRAKNHTVTQSAFSKPCEKIGFTTGTNGFDSGFMPVAANATTFPTYSFTVNDTAPIWVYCKQTNPVSHCGTGMVFAVNANESSPNTFEAFVALAKQQNGTDSGSSNGNSSGTPPPTTQNAASSVHTLSGFLINASIVFLGLLFLLRQE